MAVKKGTRKSKKGKALRKVKKLEATKPLRAGDKQDLVGPA